MGHSPLKAKRIFCNFLNWVSVFAISHCCGVVEGNERFLWVLEVVYLLDDSCVWKDCNFNWCWSIKPMKQQMLSLASLTIMGLHFCSLDKLVRKDGFYRRKSDFLFFHVAVCYKTRPMGFSLLWLTLIWPYAVTESMCPVFLFQIYSPLFSNLPLAGKLQNASRCCAVLSSLWFIRNASNCSMLQACQSCGWGTLANNPVISLAIPSH